MRHRDKEDDQMMRLKKWSECQESLLADLANRCQSRSVMHHNEWRRYYRWNSLVSIPSIVLTMLCGAASTSQSSVISLIGPGSTEYVPLVIGLLSMFVSILNSISSFLKIPTLTEQHLQAHQSFGKIQRGIASEIQVAAADRTVSGKECVKKYEELFVAMLDIAPPVSKKTELGFSKRPDISSVLTSVPPSIKMIPVKTYHELERERKQKLIEAQKEVEILHMKNRQKLEIEMVKQQRKLARTKSKAGLLRPPLQNTDNVAATTSPPSPPSSPIQTSDPNAPKAKVRRQKKGGRTKEIKKELAELQKNDRVRSMSLKLMNDDETASEMSSNSSSNDDSSEEIKVVVENDNSNNNKEEDEAMNMV